MKSQNWNSNISRIGLLFFAASTLSKPLYASPATNMGSTEDVQSIERSLNAVDELLNENVINTPTKADIQPSATPLSKEDVLADKQNRVSDEFAIPKGLEKRVAFWFDVYTKYSDKTHVIHHVLYPWVIFKIVDTTPIDQMDLHKWTKYHKAKRFVSQETAAVRQALRRLSKRTSFNNLKGLEKEIFDSLAQIPGNRRKVVREAANNMRVQLGQKDFFLSGLASSARYLPYMEKEFEAAGVPVELARLPFVESSFNEKAHSKVGASGIWQIMPYTGRAYFRVTDTIDERNSPLKASIVAIDLFRSNYRQLKDWPLAVTAYNHGAGGIKKALRNSKTTNLPDLISRYHQGSFKFASANFYTCFLAAMHAERYSKEVFPALTVVKAEPMVHHIFSLNRPMKVNRVIQLSGIDKEQFLEYNLDLKHAMKQNTSLPKGFKILVPPLAKKNLEMNLGPQLFKEADISLNRGKKNRI